MISNQVKSCSNCGNSFNEPIAQKEIQSNINDGCEVIYIDSKPYILLCSEKAGCCSKIKGHCTYDDEKYTLWVEKIEFPEKVDRDKKEAKFSSFLEKTYGITLDDYTDLLISQKNCCAICGTSVSVLPKRLYVDHCHSTGRVRGLLCNSCNSSLGFIERADIKAVLNYLNIKSLR